MRTFGVAPRDPQSLLARHSRTALVKPVCFRQDLSVFGCSTLVCHMPDPWHLKMILQKAVLDLWLLTEVGAT